jgi:ATP-dependent Lon protease
MTVGMTGEITLRGRVLPVGRACARKSHRRLTALA